ncbi:DUF4233 domain-containing protein [Nocardia cyriacigeorgica]|uniref:DUF4233 domain-containing protein n=1 Tax=Nocardia cyriacigeorgica TaxID=135487 RepID=UPI000CEA0B8D|nr:DUF4233 domain-containing protein [Nocardia cyriacigeorgica]MBF6089282.1 DUF4233 domain-containing protein [Nocardia cyriacigeorgica]MBF6093858.1 DUF4233 domain-containing protein [Nocardia cyriacigeorgica]MBF6398142.1 DUF4233 domain-containing protein [Nocardia cyriacigeorgica]MBF6404344.1 DUF4233 domain-containing protein [Nocardia cyriacigeorgica]
MSESDPRPNGDEEAAAENSPAAPAPPDPWKGLRGVMAGTLVLEAIVVLLALPVVADVGGGLSWLSGTYLVTLAVVMILGAGLQRRPWAVPFNLGLQVLVIAGAFIHVSIGVIGILFAIVWAFILILRNDVKRRMDLGVLPSQRVQRTD